jgi:hypothetical protein
MVTSRRSDIPNYISGKKGRNWTSTLRRAHDRGAVILVEATGETVTYQPQPSSRAAFRPWVVLGGTRRYDSRDCIPVF